MLNQFKCFNINLIFFISISSVNHYLQIFLLPYNLKTTLQSDGISSLFIDVPPCHLSTWNSTSCERETKEREREKEANKSDIIDKGDRPGTPIEKLLRNWLHKFTIFMFINFFTRKLLSSCNLSALFFSSRKPTRRCIGAQKVIIKSNVEIKGKGERLLVF